MLALGGNDNTTKKGKETKNNKVWPFKYVFISYRGTWLPKQIATNSLV